MPRHQHINPIVIWYFHRNECVTIQHASICASTVESSSNVNLVSPTTQRRCFLVLFTPASHRPPKCGLCSGMNFHSIPRLEQKSAIELWTSCLDRNLNISFNSRFALTKLVPWSLKMSIGHPQRATNRCRAEIKASLVKSETASRCTALTFNEIKRHISLDCRGFMNHTIFDL